MADNLTSQKRSWNMSRIRSRDTKPELAVRSLLHRMGFRFSLQRKDLPGKPDIILPKHKTVIFVHGCFWHRHEKCRYAYKPKSRKTFWNAKFKENVRRDRQNLRALKQMGWKSVVFWECTIENQEVLKGLIGKCLKKKE